MSWEMQTASYLRNQWLAQGNVGMGMSLQGGTEAGQGGSTEKAECGAMWQAMCACMAGDRPQAALLVPSIIKKQVQHALLGPREAGPRLCTCVGH